MECLRGQLLVAGPTLLDPNFHRTVVLIADHGEEGALGVVLNREAEMTTGDAVPELAGALDDDGPLMVGGPVRREGVVVLAEWASSEKTLPRFLDDVGLLPPELGLEELARLSHRARAFAGYAGWSAGQLESELERDDWLVLPAEPDDVFCDDPAQLWRTVLERQGGEIALLARMPDDPSVN